MRKLILTLCSLSFLLFSPDSQATGPDPGIGATPRSIWWPAEYKEAGRLRSVLVRRGSRRRRAVYRTQKIEAPSRDICGYGQRCWVQGSARVSSYAEIVWHHTDGSQSPNLVSMALEHRAKKFCDLSYHFVIKRDNRRKWRIYEGTPLGFVGSHACGHNFLEGTTLGTLGIAVAGDYGQQAPDRELIAIMTTLQDKLVKKFKIRDIRTHRDGNIAVNSGHDCPGKKMLPYILQLRARVVKN